MPDCLRLHLDVTIPADPTRPERVVTEIGRVHGHLDRLVNLVQPCLEADIVAFGARPRDRGRSGA
jgi:hypothetical protein